MPIVAAIPAIIGGVSAVVGGVSASKKAKQQQQILQQQTNQQQQLVDEQVKGATMARGYAAEYLPKAASFLDKTGDYWSKLFSGDKATVNTAMAPEVNSYLGNSRNAEMSLYNQSARGTTGDRLIDLTFKRAGDLFGMRANQKNNAATALQNIGSIYGQMGQNFLSNASGTTSAASGALQGMTNNTMQMYNGYNQQAGGIGQGLGQLLSAFNWKAGNVKDFFGGGGE